MDSIVAIPPVVAFHLAAAILAIGIGARQLIGRKGDSRHRFWGRLWTAAIAIASLSSFAIFEINDGRPSVIHFLSAWTLIALAIAIISLYRRRRVADAESREKYLRRHRNFMVGAYIGLIAAAVGAFLPGRLLPNILSGFWN